MPSAFWSDVCLFVCILMCCPTHSRGSAQAGCRCLRTYLILEGYYFMLCPAGQEVLSSLGSKREKYSNIQNNALTNQIRHEETKHLCSENKVHTISKVSQPAVSPVHMSGTTMVPWELKWDMVIGRERKVLGNNTEFASSIPNSETIALSEYHSQEYPKWVQWHSVRVQ